MSGIPEWMSVAATIAAPVIGLGFLWMLTKVFLRFRKRHYAEVIEQSITLLTWIYAIGVILKMSGLGPEFGRYYLADIGFPVVLIYVASLFLESRLKYEDRSTEDKLLRSDMQYAKNRLKLVPVALGIAICYELLAGYINRSAEAPVPYIGDFDWIDVLMYIVGSAATAGLLLWKLSLYRAFFNSAQRLEDAKQHARTIAAQLPSPQQSRKRYKKKVRRGVR